MDYQAPSGIKSGWTNNHATSKLWAFGSNGSGQLGVGHNHDISAPELVIGSSAISTPAATSIAAGGNHTVILYGDQKIATTGDNPDGRCFTISEKTSNAPTIFDTPPDISGADTSSHQVAATWSATFIQCRLGMPFTCGSGNAGELGMDKRTLVSRKTARIPDFGPDGTYLVNTAAGVAHVVGVLSNGEVWGWGNGRKGQLGSPNEVVWTPRKIDGIAFHAVRAICGKDFTCVFGPPSTGEMVVIGLEGNDRFELKSSVPSTVPGWKQVAASWGGVYVLLETGKLLGWGRDDHRQLPPHDLPALASMAAGSEHCLGLTTDGKVLAWGWGEHGNCGMPTDKRGDVTGGWNEIPMPLPATDVFAGCATSFVVTHEP